MIIAWSKFINFTYLLLKNPKLVKKCNDVILVSAQLFIKGTMRQKVQKFLQEVMTHHNNLSISTRKSLKIRETSFLKTNDNTVFSNTTHIID